MNGTRICSRCSEEKSLDDFHRKRANSEDRRTECKSCTNARNSRAHRESVARDPEARRTTSARWRAQNAERMAELKARWREENPERVSQHNASYRTANPERSWLDEYRRRTRKFGHPDVIEDFTKADVIERYGDRCFYCWTGEFEELDHFIAVIHGGPHTLDNVRPSCMPCNRSKGRGERKP